MKICHRPLLNADAFCELSDEDGEILYICRYECTALPGSERDEGAGEADYAGNGADEVMAKVDAVSSHVSDFA